MNLRCWPGCTAIITEQCVIECLRGKTIVCTTYYESSASALARTKFGLSGYEWRYAGSLFRLRRSDGKVFAIEGFDDAHLVPITPHPHALIGNADEKESHEVVSIDE